MEPLFPSLEEVLEIHRQQIERYGGASGVRDLALLEIRALAVGPIRRPHHLTWRGKRPLRIQTRFHGSRKTKLALVAPQLRASELVVTEQRWEYHDHQRRQFIAQTSLEFRRSRALSRFTAAHVSPPLRDLLLQPRV